MPAPSYQIEYLSQFEFRQQQYMLVMFENHSVQVVDVESGQSVFEFDFAARKTPKPAIDLNVVDKSEREPSPFSAAFFFSTDPSIPRRESVPRRLFSGVTRLDSSVGSAARRDTLLHRQ